ncbi:PREDICTED: cation/H(+) antiporter 6A-like [Camelina sativa]|uniref:Cation/H(+) antiporter 6A-like n=1 Tax=Camelina sativa TaxID=90675 RepID=A0ABM1QW32_CAMSA|nr:PREDICTED: cation/H(+) antiporter 6A-like [Camelina sativa]
MSLDLDRNYWDVSQRGYKEDNKTSRFCETHPYIVNSHGIWEVTSYDPTGMSFWEYPLPNLEILMFSTFLIWRLLDFSCNKIGLRFPRLAYMMIAGVILGQTCHLSNKSWLHNIFFPDDKRPKVAETLGAFGFLLYWFLKGVTMDAGMPFRMGKKSAVLGLTTMIVPVICGSFVFRWRERRGIASLLRTEYRLILFLQSISAFTSVDTLLKDLKIKHSEFGRIALSGAMVTDMLAFVLTFFNAIYYEGYRGVMQTIGFCTFVALMIYVVRPSMYWVIKQTPEGRPVKDVYIYWILALAFASFHYFIKLLHLFGPAGSFVLGLTVPNGDPLGTTLVQKFESFNLGAILPLFGSLTTMQLDLLWLLKECRSFVRMKGQVYEVISFILLVNSTKFIASTIAAYSFKMPLRDSFALAFVFNNKGIFELAYYAFAVEIKTSLDIFTSVSMSQHMHEDICWLALSRSLSLIVLPFHRTWSSDRSTIISNDDKLRILNINVLKRAPCSVGIFIYRKPIVESHLAKYQSKICLIFNGGNDDIEALAIANRMRLTEKGTSLTIIRFIPKFAESDNQEWEQHQMVNLKENVSNIIGSNVKKNDDKVKYIDKAVSDGSETSKTLRAMANDYDLFIVGRSSGIGTEPTSGISEWTEFDELGPIGDLLASHEYPSRASVLVVQKQEYIHHTKSQKRLSKK